MDGGAPCALTNITLFNRTHNKVKYWTYSCELTNGHTIKWSMTIHRQCCESYASYVGTAFDRESVMCTDYDTNIIDTRCNVINLVGRNCPNINYCEIPFSGITVLIGHTPTAESSPIVHHGKRQIQAGVATLKFGNKRLDSLQLSMQCNGRYSHPVLLEITGPTGELLVEKTFNLC